MYIEGKGDDEQSRDLQLFLSPPCPISARVLLCWRNPAKTSGFPVFLQEGEFVQWGLCMTARHLLASLWQLLLWLGLPLRWVSAGD